MSPRRIILGSIALRQADPPLAPLHRGASPPPLTGGHRRPGSSVPRRGSSHPDVGIGPLTFSGQSPFPRVTRCPVITSTAWHRFMEKGHFPPRCSWTHCIDHMGSVDVLYRISGDCSFPMNTALLGPIGPTPDDRLWTTVLSF